LDGDGGADSKTIHLVVVNNDLQQDSQPTREDEEGVEVVLQTRVREEAQKEEKMEEEVRI